MLKIAALAAAKFHGKRILNVKLHAQHETPVRVDADDKKKMADLTAAAVESSTTNLLAVNPKMSYVLDSWKTASPDFWDKQ